MSFRKICEMGNFDFIEWIVGEYPEMITCVTQDVFLRAISNNRLNFVERLITSGIDVNVPNSWGQHPLEIAEFRPEILKLLLLRKDIDINVNIGHSWEYKCFLRRHVRHHELLELALQTDSAQKNERNLIRALHSAVGNGDARSIKLILKHPKLNPNKIICIYSVLMSLARSDNPDQQIVELLLEDPRINVNTLNDSCETAFQFAVMKRNYSMAKAIMNHKTFNVDLHKGFCMDQFILMQSYR